MGKNKVMPKKKEYRKITKEKLIKCLGLIDWKLGSCGDGCFTLINNYGDRANLFIRFLDELREARFDIWDSQPVFGKGEADYEHTGSIHFYLKNLVLDYSSWKMGWITFHSRATKPNGQVGFSLYNFSDNFKKENH